jgi:hypothetical protein
MPWVNVSLISSSRGISIGVSVEISGVVSGIGASSVSVQDCWKRDAASRGVDRRRDVMSNVFCSISRCSDWTCANNSASKGSMSALVTPYHGEVPSCSLEEDKDGFIPFTSNEELAMSNVRDTYYNQRREGYTSSSISSTRLRRVSEWMLETAVGGRCISNFCRVASDIFDLRNCTSFAESRDISVIFSCLSVRCLVC